jgi:hypothetical protein
LPWEDDNDMFNAFDDSWLILTSCDIENMRDNLCNVYPVLRTKCAVHSCGELQLGSSEWIMLENILHDTGSISANYISKQLVDRYRIQLKDKIRKRNHYVTLAEKGNTVTTNEEVYITLRFTEEKGSKRTFKYTGMFIVLSMDCNDIIMGLPAILNELFDFFVNMLGNAREEHMRDSDFYVNNMDTNLIDPWSFPVERIAPEEDFVPEPTSFPDILTYLTSSYEEAIEDYHKLLDTHVSEEMKSQTEVLNILKKKGHLVFVPKVWEGIKNVPDLELKWKDNLPERMKPAVRPINTALWDK